MKKYDCNNTLDYSHEFRRMCKTFRSSRGQKICKGCPLSELPCDILSVASEHIRRVQIWSDTHPEITLTETQVEILKALNLLGFSYIAKDKDGRTWVYSRCPVKGSRAWVGQGEYHCAMHLGVKVASTAPTLVSWEDKEPLDIDVVLKNNQ